MTRCAKCEAEGISEARAREVIRGCFTEDFLEEAMLELRSQLDGKGNQNSPG